MEGGRPQIFMGAWQPEIQQPSLDKPMEKGRDMICRPRADEGSAASGRSSVMNCNEVQLMSRKEEEDLIGDC
jgi:hypothetical protein